MSGGKNERPEVASRVRRIASGRARRRRLSATARALLEEWKRLCLPVADERAVIAVSGGADSVALLLALSELSETGRLGLKLTVAHLNHGLRGEEGAEDARWVGRLADELGVEALVGYASVKKRAANARDNLEQAARRARYQFLEEVAKRFSASLVLTAHTMDDQAETVLLRLLRGSGAEGLGGIERVRPIAEGSDILLVRPLLSWARRADTESYCRERGVEFRVDSMNEDERFARVRVRRKVLPLLETFNPRVVESLARTADLLREDASALNAAAEWALRSASEEEKDVKGERGACVVAPLRVDVLRLISAPIRRRALRLWLARGRGDLRRLELVHLLGVERLLAGERGGRVAELPAGSFVERRRGRLVLKSRSQESEARRKAEPSDSDPGFSSDS